MNDRNIVQKLLTGFHNVDRMRRETNELLNSLMGLIRKGELRCTKMRDEYSETFVSADGKYQWRVSGVVYYNDCETKLTIECWAQISGTSGTHKCVEARYGQDTWFAIGTKSILEAHEALPSLVNGLLNKFPFMKERCEPFFQAAEVTFG